MRHHHILFGVTLVALSASFLNVHAQNHSLEPIWTSDSVFKIPESVFFDTDGQVLYVSNMRGNQNEGDTGMSSIGKLGLDGKVITAEWVKGLQEPKGMALNQGMLYVGDLTDLVVIDVAKSAIAKKIPVPGAAVLNDVTIGTDGAVYASDSKNKKIFKVVNDKAEVLVENLNGPNGVLFHDGQLVITDKGGLYKVGDDKKLTKIADGMEGDTDGIAYVGNGEYVVSCWSGIMYYVKADGSTQVLLDTRETKSNTADIGYDPAKKIVFVPTFFKKLVAAYQLK